MIRETISTLALLAIAGASVGAQDYGNRLGQGRGEDVQFPTTGPSILSAALDPRVQKWYLPQELYSEYRLNQWSYTHYAKDFYRRYLQPDLEGDYFYDLFGRRVMHGWLIYEARKEQPRASEGNSLLKSPLYGGNFQNLIISSDAKGQYRYALTIGDEIRTTLTPMTFRKAVFNGIQFDYLADRYAGTALLSRVSAPLVATSDFGVGLTNATELKAGRATAQVGDHVTIGGTYVNTHNSRATLERFSGNMFKGFLTTDQAANAVSFVEIRLGDDSPEDGAGGAILFAENAILEDVAGHTWESTQVGYTPVRTGGQLRDGFPVADGNERMTLRYNLETLAAARIVQVDGEPTLSPTTVDSLAEVRFELVLANDYRIEITSDRQTNIEGQPVFLPVQSARRNVKDTSNRRTVRFDYGLPTANQIAGFTVAVHELWGFNLYAEMNVNHRFVQYPSPLLETHRTAAQRANAWMVNLSQVRSPYFFHLEAFSMDPDYTTSIFMTETNGRTDFADEATFFYDYVDDNDDQDRFPDQKRRWQSVSLSGSQTGEGAVDPAVFPGWDENGDFISDFNQNDNPARRNSIVDYEEPFLRFSVDRPEFLFGIDLNNNGWIDRFEDDADPDYPYDRDHRGYNVYGGVDVLPSAVRLTAGQTRQWVLSSGRRSEVAYGLFTFERDWAAFGRLRVFEHLKKVRDNIADDRIAAPKFFRDSQFTVEDPLPAQDTWINTFWLGFDYVRLAPLYLVNKFKCEFLHQRDKQPVLDERGARRTARFVGLVNKADYGFDVRTFHIRPRLKNEFFWDIPYLKEEEKRHWWKQMLSLSVKFPILKRSWIETGIEQVFTTNLGIDEEGLAPGLHTGDARQTVLALQLTNYGTYVGYRSIMQFGLRYDRDRFERLGRKSETRTGSLVFLSFYTGLK